MRQSTKRVMRRTSLLLVVAAAGSVLTATSARATILFESGALGPTGLTFADFGGTVEPSGSFVSGFNFTGVRFELTQPAITKRLGGHFVVDPGHDDSFFGAAVRLSSAVDFPDSGDLSTSDVLGHTLLSFPNTSAEVFGNLALSLDSGWYALVFGSGLFGTTGQGAAIANNPDIGSPTYFAHQVGAGWFDFSPPNGPFHNFRFEVEGSVIPEPTFLVLAMEAATFLLALRRPIKKSCLE